MKKRYLIKAVKFLVRILPTSFWLVLIFAFDKPYIAILTLLSAFIHELGHIIAFMKFSKKYRFYSVASGFRLSSENGLSYKEELICALSGPLANVLCALALSPFILLGPYGYAKIFGAVNLFTAISNLVPIEGYDGYRISACLINQYTNLGLSATVLKAISFILSSFICLIALYLLRSFDGGYWIFFIFLASLIKAISSDRRSFPKKRG